MAAPRKPKDLESELMGGCMVIVFTSLIAYGLGIWPHMVWHEFRLTDLMTIIGCAWLPCLVFGVLAVRKFRESGLTGFIGGAMCYGIFLYMRLMQMFVAEDNPDLPHADWPKFLSIGLPALWAVLAVGVAAVAYPRQKQAT